MRVNTFQLRTKTLNVKGSRADTTAANAAAVRKVIPTSPLSAGRDEVSVYLNCDTGGTFNLDGDIQVTPDNPLVGTPIWYKTDGWTQVTTGASQQVKVPAALGLGIRITWTLTGVHNFGAQLSYPLFGWTN